MRFASAVPILVAIDYELNIVAIIFLVESAVALPQVTQFTVQSRHK